MASATLRKWRDSRYTFRYFQMPSAACLQGIYLANFIDENDMDKEIAQEVSNCLLPKLKPRDQGGGAQDLTAQSSHQDASVSREQEATRAIAHKDRHHL